MLVAFAHGPPIGARPLVPQQGWLIQRLHVRHGFRPHTRRCISQIVGRFAALVLVNDQHLFDFIAAEER